MAAFNGNSTTDARRFTDDILTSIRENRDAHTVTRIALFGLSGNPPTSAQGHFGIVNTLMSLIGGFTHILIMPVFEHIFSKKLVPFGHRMKMCELCFSDISSLTRPTSPTKLPTSASTSAPACEVVVVPLEQVVSENMSVTHPGQRVGTIDIVDYLQQHINIPGRPEVEIHLVLGKDTFRDLVSYKWKQSERLIKLVHLDVFHREGIELELVASQLEDWKVTQHRILSVGGDLSDVDVCSTKVREYLLTGQDHLAQRLLYPAVFAYIKEHNLYTAQPENEPLALTSAVTTSK
jgi:nicotinic acid mononucleotide adenylyltransferase